MIHIGFTYCRIMVQSVYVLSILAGQDVFEKVYVFSLTERDKTVKRTSAWSFCLQKRMFLKTE